MAGESTSFLSTRVGLGLVAALYLLAFPYHPGLRSPNELSRLWQSRAIVDHGKLSLNETLREFGFVGDLARFDTPTGRLLYSSKAPLLSFAGVPVYWALKAFGTPVTELGQVFFSRLFLTVLPTLWMLWLLRRFLRAQLEERVADLLVVTYGLGTMAFSYAEIFMSHQVTAVLLFASFYAAWQVVRGAWARWGWLAAGAASGAAVMAEYTAALGVLCVAGYVVAALWKQWGRLGLAVALVVAGAAPFLGGLMAYHQACFGGPLESGYKHLNDPGYQGWHLGGFMGIRLPSPRAFVLSFFSPLRGLFALSPFLLLAFFGLKALLKKDRPQLLFVGLFLAAMAYFTSSFTYDSWGWTVGPRHMTILLPFLLVPVGLTLQGLQEKGNVLGFSVAAGLCLTSVAGSQLVAFVAYVPDDVSTSLFGLAVPLLADGVWPVSWLAAGLPNPASGLVLLVLLGAVLVWLTLRFKALSAVPLVVVLVWVAHFGLLRAVTKNDDHDVAARAFLTKVWLAPRGATFDFLP